MLDELINVPWDPHLSYGNWLYLMPEVLYNDRPLGRVTEIFLYKTFAFDYSRSVAAFLLLHFANCVLAYRLFRELKVSAPIGAGCIALFGSLTTTAQTATYLGASFDIVCTLFLLSSMLASLGRRWFHPWLSACFYLLALRSKEFSIVLPLVLTVLLFWQESSAQKAKSSGFVILRAVLRRLWMHYAIFAVWGTWYLHLALKDPIPAGNPYHLQFQLPTIVRSLVYYIALAFQRDESRRIWLPATLFLLIVLYGFVRRDLRMLFALCAFLLLILPAAALPNMRSPFYAYCPQIFVILAIALLLDSLTLSIPAAHLHKWGALTLATILLLCGFAVQSGSYFRARVAWIRNARSACARTARSVEAYLQHIGPSSHLYFSSGSDIPFLMVPGPCHYLHLIRHDDSIPCWIQKPEAELRALYDADRSEKYFLDYSADGSFTVRDSFAGRN